MGGGGSADLTSTEEVRDFDFSAVSCDSLNGNPFTITDSSCIDDTYALSPSVEKCDIVDEKAHYKCIPILAVKWIEIQFHP